MFGLQEPLQHSTGCNELVVEQQRNRKLTCAVKFCWPIYVENKKDQKELFRIKSTTKIK